MSMNLSELELLSIKGTKFNNTQILVKGNPRELADVSIKTDLQTEDKTLKQLFTDRFNLSLINTLSFHHSGDVDLSIKTTVAQKGRKLSESFIKGRLHQIHAFTPEGTITFNYTPTRAIIKSLTGAHFYSEPKLRGWVESPTLFFKGFDWQTLFLQGRFSLENFTVLKDERIELTAPFEMKEGALKLNIYGKNQKGGSLVSTISLDDLKTKQGGFNLSLEKFSSGFLEEISSFMPLFIGNPFNLKAEGFFDLNQKIRIQTKVDLESDKLKTVGRFLIQDHGIILETPPLRMQGSLSPKAFAKIYDEQLSMLKESPFTGSFDKFHLFFMKEGGIDFKSSGFKGEFELKNLYLKQLDQTLNFDSVKAKVFAESLEDEIQFEIKGTSQNRELLKLDGKSKNLFDQRGKIDLKNSFLSLNCAIEKLPITLLKNPMISMQEMEALFGKLNLY